MNILNTNNTKIDFVLLVSLLVGYIFVCALPSIFNIESRGITVPYRFLIFFLSVCILLKNRCLMKGYVKNVLVISVFWIIYFIKTVYSFNTDYYFPQFINLEYEVYLRIFIINFFPCLAILSINYAKVDFELLIKSLFWILFIMLSLNLLYTLFYLNEFNNISGIFSVYYISSGHFGASLVILSFYLLIFKTSSETIINRTALLIGILLGLFAIYISAARSPVLALIIAGVYFIILKKRAKYIYSFIIMLLLFVIFIYCSNQIFHLESSFVDRNYSWIFEGNTSGRGLFLENGITIFKNNVLLGGRVLYEDGMYPHNIFVELLMSGGVLLLMIFCLIFYPLIRNIKYYLNLSNSNINILPLFVLWLQYFALTQTSNNIHSNPEFWYFSCVIIGISIKTYNEKT